MANGGHVLNISSGLTRFALKGYAAYALMKGAIEVLTKYIAKEYGPKNIRANVVAPGALDTEFGGGRTDEVRQMIGSFTALGRIGVADDAGLFITSLLDEDSRWVNAQRIEVSGGMFL